jgi:hypothetical protein
VTLARILFPALLLVSGMAHGDYRFESAEFALADAPWTRSDRVVGTVDFDGPLPTWVDDIDLRSRVTALEFFDGVRTRRLADTEICEFQATIDAMGAIIDWSLKLRQRPLPPPGMPQHSITFSPRQVIVVIREAGETLCGDQGGLLAFSIANRSSTMGDSGVEMDQATYRYASAPFVSAEDPFEVGDSFVATIQFAGPIPPSRTGFELAPFVEGVAVEPAINPYVWGVSVCSLRVDTDASGRIAEWQGVVTEQVPQPIIGPPPGFDALVRAWGLSSAGDDARFGFFSACDDAPLALAASGGTWRGGAVVPVPTLGPWALNVLALALLVLGLRRFRLAQSLSADR